jgi:1,2-diacylglycerol 3-alpha-glucosyltransferase
MKVAMLTNTYLPLVGGVSNSVQSYADAVRAAGHDVLVVAPEFKDMPESEQHVLRVPATQKLTSGKFAVHLPMQSELVNGLKAFKPDVIHSHHPFLLGDTALRLSTSLNVPLVYTYHTQYEHYTHYLHLEDSEKLKRLAIEISVGYCNMTHHVIAPSESIRDILRSRGVTTDITVIPTGIDLNRFSNGDGDGFRQTRCILDDTFVIGYVGRLAPEKNCRFMAESAAEFVRSSPDALFLVIGDGSQRKEIIDVFQDAGIPHRLLTTGVLKGQDLVDAYHAMDTFLFASVTETQGMVLAEALSTGIPVVALDAPGAREVIDDRQNGRLVTKHETAAMAAGLQWVQSRLKNNPGAYRDQIKLSVTQYSRDVCVEKILGLYKQIQKEYKEQETRYDSKWRNLMDRLEQEWDIWSHRVSAVQAALIAEDISLDEPTNE